MAAIKKRMTFMFTFLCLPVFTLVYGSSSNLLSDCSEVRHCWNGGTCDADGMCICPLGTYGSLCYSPICDPSCQNGGTCNGTSEHSGNCVCPSTTTGTYCQYTVCTPPCQNGGTCREFYDSTPCDCPSGYKGRYCENAVCYPACENGGTCNGTSSTGHCVCPSGTSGSYCQYTDGCTPPCQNGGTCEELPMRLLTPCYCPSGFTGRYCEEAVCNPACLNGGTCNKTSSPAHCDCPSDSSGSYCQFTACTLACQNGGTCYDSDPSAHCACPLGYSGTYCEDKLGVILGGVFGGIVIVLILLCCTCCLVVKLARNKRRRNARFPEVIDEEDCSPDVQLLNPDLWIPDTAASTRNQIECPPNTSEEDISLRAPPQPFPPEAPPPTPNSEGMSEQLTSITLVRRTCNPWIANYPPSTSEADMPTPPQSLPIWPETPTTNSNIEDPWSPDDQPLTLVRRRSSPVSCPLASSSSVEDTPTPPRPFLPEISFPSPNDEDPPERLLSRSSEHEERQALIAAEQ